MIRPIKTGSGSFKCPNSYEVCDPEGTNIDTAVCVRNGKKYQCPITDLTFDLEAERIKAKKDTFVAVGNEDVKLYFSKNGDQLPITDIKLSTS